MINGSEQSAAGREAHSVLLYAQLGACSITQWSEIYDKKL